MRPNPLFITSAMFSIASWSVVAGLNLLNEVPLYVLASVVGIAKFALLYFSRRTQWLCLDQAKPVALVPLVTMCVIAESAAAYASLKFIAMNI